MSLDGIAPVSSTTGPITTPHPLPSLAPALDHDMALRKNTLTSSKLPSPAPTPKDPVPQVQCRSEALAIIRVV